MATDLAGILADLRAETMRSPRHDPSVAVDARVALSRLRPALDRLREDGLDTGASIDVDPDAFSRQADRVHWVRLLATTCDTLGRSVPTPAHTGRLTDLADAAAVAATLRVDSMTGGERWATVAALARTAHVLTDAAAGGEQESPEASRALIIAEASSSVLFQFASLDPPSAADNAALLRPVPNPAREATLVEQAVLEASAALVHATRPGTGPHPISDILAIAMAASTVCRSVGSARHGWTDDSCGASATDAAQAWIGFRDELGPFHDGSRRPQTGRPPAAVQHARTLHDIFQASAQDTHLTDLRNTATTAVLDRLETVAHHLTAALEAGVTSGQFMAYAVDLPYRDSRIGQHLRGRRVPGLVTADAADLAPVVIALGDARNATTALARSMTPSGVLSSSEDGRGKFTQPLSSRATAATPTMRRSARR